MPLPLPRNTLKLPVLSPSTVATSSMPLFLKSAVITKTGAGFQKSVYRPVRESLRHAKINETVTVEPRQAFRRAEPNEAA